MFVCVYKNKKNVYIYTSPHTHTHTSEYTYIIGSFRHVVPTSGIEFSENHSGRRFPPLFPVQVFMVEGVERVGKTSYDVSVAIVR